MHHYHNDMRNFKYYNLEPQMHTIHFPFSLKDGEGVNSTVSNLIKLI